MEWQSKYFLHMGERGVSNQMIGQGMFVIKELMAAGNSTCGFKFLLHAKPFFYIMGCDYKDHQLMIKAIIFHHCPF